MKTFDVFEHPLGAPEAVKQGFSWPGFFFTWIWALAKGLVAEGVLILVLALVATIVDLGVGAQGVLSTLVGLGIAVVVGTSGNGWRATKLVERGYRMQTSVIAGSPASAVAQLLRERASRGSTSHGPGIEVRQPCPHCAELILPAARVCRYCGRQVEGE